MKKKWGSIVAGIGVCVFLIVAAGIYCWSAGVFRRKPVAEETTTHLVQVRPKTREEMQAKCDFQLGDYIKVNDLVWCVTAAEVIEGYENLDEYYQKNELLTEGERSYLVLEYSVTNDSTEERVIYPGSLQFYNKYAATDFRDDFIWYNSAGRSLGGAKLVEGCMISAAAGTTHEFEWVWEFDETDDTMHDLYVSFDVISGINGSNWGNQMQQKMRLFWD